MNRQQRRAQAAQARKSATIDIYQGKPVHGVRGSLTGSNRSRPIRRYKVAKGNVNNMATMLLRVLGVEGV